MKSEKESKVLSFRLACLSHKYLSVDYDSSPSPHFEVNVRREENDIEYNKRLQDEAERKASIEKREAAEFARLQKKFSEKK